MTMGTQILSSEISSLLELLRESGVLFQLLHKYQGKIQTYNRLPSDYSPVDDQNKLRNRREAEFLKKAKGALDGTVFNYSAARTNTKISLI